MEAAIEVSEIITRFAQQHGSRHFKPRVGLHDGDVYVGHTGGGGRFLYSIVGDAANTAARLESLNKHLGTHVLAAESVARDANETVARPLGAFRLRGKAEPTSIFEILGRTRQCNDQAPRSLRAICRRACRLSAQRLGNSGSAVRVDDQELRRGRTKPLLLAALPKIRERAAARRLACCDSYGGEVSGALEASRHL